MQDAFRGHIVVLCDHGRFRREAFSEGVKRLKLAKVMGMRTWGGEVWLSFDNMQVDKRHRVGGRNRGLCRRKMAH